MKKNKLMSILIPMVSIIVGGAFLLAIVYIGYLFLYLFIESVIIRDPSLVPAQMIRIGYMVFLMVIYFFIYKSKMHEIFKAIAMIPTLGMALVALVLGNYDNLKIVYVGLAIIIIGLLVLLYLGKKPWYYYYAAALTFAIAIAYAWP